MNSDFAFLFLCLFACFLKRKRKKGVWICVGWDGKAIEIGEVKDIQNIFLWNIFPSKVFLMYSFYVFQQLSVYSRKLLYLDVWLY